MKRNVSATYSLEMQILTGLRNTVIYIFCFRNKNGNICSFLNFSNEGRTFYLEIE